MRLVFQLSNLKKASPGKDGILARRAISFNTDITDPFSGVKSETNGLGDSGTNSGKNLSSRGKSNLVSSGGVCTYQAGLSWIILANYFSVCSDHNRSIICLKKSINLHLNSYSLLLYAHELMIKHEYEKALRIFHKTLRMNSHSYSALYGIGTVISKGTYLEDTDLIYLTQDSLQALETTPENPSIGNFLAGNSGNSTAEHFFRMALQIVPLNKAVRYQLIRYLVKRRELENGLTEIHGYFSLVLKEENLTVPENLNIPHVTIPGRPVLSRSTPSKSKMSDEDSRNSTSANLVNTILKQMKCLFNAHLLNKSTRSEYNDFIILELVEILFHLNSIELADSVCKMVNNLGNDLRYRKRREMLDREIGKLE